MDPATPADGGPARRLDEVFGRVAATSPTPGAQASLVRDGSLIWSSCYGLADVESVTPVVDSTVFCLASLGKTMVAALTLRLVGDGLFALDAPVASVVGSGVPGADVVTVRMLLTHTSGYPDIYGSPEVLALMPPQEGEVGSGSQYDPDRAFTWEMLGAGMREPVEPGARWEYSNAGYLLLGRVLTVALDGPGGLRRAWTALVEPMGGEIRLTPDRLTMDRAEVDLGSLARGYELRPDGSVVDAYAGLHPAGVPADLFGLPFTDGLFAGTAVGVAGFLDALFGRRALLDSPTVDLMSTVTAQAAAADAPHPDLNTYGMGTFQMSVDDAVWQGHRGRYGGFSAVGATRRADASTLAVLTNAMSDDPPVEHLWRELAATV